jgi:tryptophan halogenase
MQIKNIVIVGGGTAGWAAAHNFLNKTSAKVTVIASEELPIIGVGESTTGRFNDLINLKNNITGLNEKEFLKETESTFKIGIKHSDWHTIGKSFYSPLGDVYENKINYPHSDYDNFKIFHVAKDLDFYDSFQAKLMQENRLHFIDKKSVYENNKFQPIAYHLDTYKVGQYLKRKAIAVKDRCNYINDKVVDVLQDEKEFVTGIKTAGGKIIKGDLFVDCSGFARLIIEKKFNNKFISYQNELMVNRALSYYVENTPNEPIKNYTHAWAQKYGWIWEIPTQKRKGCGYVYCDDYIGPEEAQKEIEKTLGHKINPLKDIKFNTGRLEKFWIKNVLSTGLASAFIEPLEATSIHATITQITHWLENYYKQDMPLECELLHKKYNNEMTEMWDNIKDFIVYHYITPRNDTEFWINSSSKDRWSVRLSELMSIWKYRMPRVVDYISDKNNNFYNIGNGLWYQISIGMKTLDKNLAKKELMDYGLWEYSEKQYDYIKNFVNEKIYHCIKTNNYYEQL